MIIAENGQSLQKAAKRVIKIVKGYNLTNKSKVMALKATHPVKTVRLTEQEMHFNYFGCTISMREKKDSETNASKCNHTCGANKNIRKQGEYIS
jgi:hypothetical protein